MEGSHGAKAANDNHFSRRRRWRQEHRARSGCVVFLRLLGWVSKIANGPLGIGEVSWICLSHRRKRTKPSQPSTLPNRLLEAEHTFKCRLYIRHAVYTLEIH